MFVLSLRKVKDFSSNKQRNFFFIMGPKEKIRQYIEYKGITIYAFEKKAGIGKGIMGKGMDFGVSLLANIRRNFSDLNLSWLIYNEGEMILTDDLMEESTSMMANESGMHYENGCRNCDHMEELLEAKNETIEGKNETIAILKHQLGINNDGDKSKAS